MNDRYALTEGIVTERTMISGEPSSSNFCYISYNVTIDGQEFSGRNDGLSDFCFLEVGDAIWIKYLKSDARRHEIASSFEIESMKRDEGGVFGGRDGLPVLMFVPFIVVFVIAVTVILMGIKRGRKMGISGDGSIDDGRPATAEQKKLIQEGFRRLGIHHEVKKKLTQAEAREILNEIDRKLKRK
ncbi:hypothetical protein FWH13_03720 [Candidatus Saccharibacteria bacterium]|nr:hypothetical protein [Candidatus Saccharibacteria bacterium]